MIPLLVVAMMAMGDLPPTEEPTIPEEHRIEILGCDRSNGICIVEIGMLRDYVKRHAETERKYKELAASKGCAKLEVIPKKIPGKRDRDS